ncbi:MAG TPA: LytTR family transcriptional regulator DNA-binding domain-containing protein [Flavitalea sp.]|nr:LytTR family transcriptional regulator DNA-binding domain-containing protein [Flavitalea sp.]
MIKAILVDDEPLARLIVKEYLQPYAEIEIAEECNDGFEGIKAISKHQPQLLFLDIQMPKITGFEMLELIEKPPATIFTTAYDEYAMKAFEANAVDYLLKPFSKERFDKAIQKALQQIRQQVVSDYQPLLESAGKAPVPFQRVVVKSNGKIRIIPASEILYLEAADDYVKIHVKEGSFLKNNTLSYFESMLSEQQFVRVHRSYLLNVSLITRIEPYEKDGHLAVLSTGTRVPVSKSGYTKLKATLGI